MKVENFFSLDARILKDLIRPTYWIAIVSVVLCGLSELMDHFVFGIIYIVLGVCLSRVIFETILLIIEIHDKHYPVAADDDEEIE